MEKEDRFCEESTGHSLKLILQARKWQKKAQPTQFIILYF